MLQLEQLERRDCLSALLTPTVSIVGVGVNAADYVPMVQVFLGDNTTLLQQAGYPIGHGTIASTVNLPSNNGTLTEAQLDQLIGQQINAGAIPAGPNTLVMVFLDKEPANPIPNAAAWHDGFVWNGQEILTTWTWLQPWESIPASHEFDEATARAAGVGFEICDAVNWQAKPLDGVNVTNFVRPDGYTPAFAPQPYVGTPWQLAPYTPPAPPAPPAPVQPGPPLADLFALGVERLESDLFGLLARFNPAFAQQADAAAQAVASNPWHGTAAGNAITQEADAIFYSAI